MDDEINSRIALDLTPAEARLVVAALRQFEPHWPADVDDLSRAEMLAEIRESIARVSGSLSTST